MNSSREAGGLVRAWDEREVPRRSSTLSRDFSVGKEGKAGQGEQQQLQAGQEQTKSMSKGNKRHSFLSWVSKSGSPVSKNGSSLFCRICHEAEAYERLISPCHCSGSVGLVHRSCVEKWLSTANYDTCELCGHKFSISRQPRPFVSWLCEPSGQEDQRNLLGDLVCFVLLTPLAAISAYLCASGASYYLQEKRSEAVGLICLSVVLVMIYIFWIALTIRYHCQVWFTWRNQNQDIRLMGESNLIAELDNRGHSVKDNVIAPERDDQMDNEVFSSSGHTLASPGLPPVRKVLEDVPGGKADDAGQEETSRQKSFTSWPSDAVARGQDGSRAECCGEQQRAPRISVASSPALSCQVLTEQEQLHDSPLSLVVHRDAEPAAAAAAMRLSTPVVNRAVVLSASCTPTSRSPNKPPILSPKPNLQLAVPSRRLPTCSQTLPPPTTRPPYRGTPYRNTTGWQQELAVRSTFTGVALVPEELSRIGMSRSNSSKQAGMMSLQRQVARRHLPQPQADSGASGAAESSSYDTCSNSSFEYTAGVFQQSKMSVIREDKESKKVAGSDYFIAPQQAPKFATIRRSRNQLPHSKVRTDKPEDELSTFF